MNKSAIGAKTSIARALDADPSALDRLAARHSSFGRFRNPLLRRTLGRLLTLADAAKLTGLPVDLLLEAAAGPRAPSAAGGKQEPPTNRPDWLDAVDAESVTRFDARAALADGEDPLADILRCADAVELWGVLVVDAPFDPSPLRRVLGNRGFSAFAEMIRRDHWRLFFRRERAAGPPGGMAPARTADGARVWRDGGIAHVDVRGLTPPEPMLAVIELIERPDIGDSLIVHHERDPVYLYAELAERGWIGETLAGEPGEVRLKLSRKPTDTAS